MPTTRGRGGFSSYSQSAEAAPKSEETTKKKVNWRDYKKDWRAGLPKVGSWRKKYGFKKRTKLGEREESVTGSKSKRTEE
jgi:hypothetical protein